MKRNLTAKVIAGGFFTIAAFVSYAATVTTTSDYFTVDTRAQFTLAPTSADWTEGSITLTCTGGTVNCTLEYSKSPLLNDWQPTDGATISQDADGNILFTDKKFVTRLDGVLPVYYRVKDPDDERTTEPCITRVRYGLAVGLGEYSPAFISNRSKWLKQCQKDVELFSEVMTKHGGGISESNMSVLKNAEATVEGIGKAWKNIIENKVATGDIVFFCIATHGTDTGKVCAYDKLYTREDFQKDIEPFRSGLCRGAKVVLLMMNCHSEIMTSATRSIADEYGGMCTANMLYLTMASAEESGWTYNKDYTQMGELLINQGMKLRKADTQRRLQGIVGEFGNGDGVVDLLEGAKYLRAMSIGISDKEHTTPQYDDAKRALMSKTILVKGSGSVTVAPQQPKITAKVISEGVKLTWAHVSNRLYYIISYSNANEQITHWRVVGESCNDLILKTSETASGDEKYIPLENGKTYSFSVIAVNAGGRSEEHKSNEAVVWIPTNRQLTPSTPSDSAGESLTFSQTYTFTSYLQLPDDGGAAGTMTVKTQKEKGGVAAATATIQPAGGKKQTIKGTISTADGTGQGALAGLTFTVSGVTGTLNGYSVDGAIDASKSKDAATVAVLNKFKGKSYVMALEPESTIGANADKVNGVAGFSIVFSAKGKAKVSGTMPDGMKVSVSSQLIVGSEWCCLPVVYSKTGNSLAFLLWFDREGNFDSVSGMTAWKGKGFEVKWNEDVAVSKVGNLSGTSYFHLADTPAEIGGAEVISELLPVDVAITPAGAKWNIAKAKAVKQDRSGNLSYGANPSGLKLTYTAKTGMFKGSLSLYTMNRGRLKKNSVTISGIVVDGIGYGTATLKKVGCWPIVINGEAAKAADFKARITGIAVVDEDAYDEVFAGVTFVSPETVLEVPYGKKAVFRIEYDFPTGYSAYLWVRDDWPATESENRYYFGTNPSSLYRDAGVAYGFVSLLETGKTCTLKSVKVRTQSEPAAADSAGEWEICTAAVNLTFREKNSASMTELDQLKAQFKATVTGVAVVDDSVSDYDDADVAAVTFLSPQTSLDVPYGATVLIRMSYDFPPGYAAQLWTCAAKWSAAPGGSSYSNPSLQHVGKGTAYGFIGLEGHSASCTLEAIRVDAGAYLTDDGERTEWGLCTTPVNITFSR